MLLSRIPPRACRLDVDPRLPGAGGDSRVLAQKSRSGTRRASCQENEEDEQEAIVRTISSVPAAMPVPQDAELPRRMAFGNGRVDDDLQHTSDLAASGRTGGQGSKATERTGICRAGLCASSAMRPGSHRRNRSGRRPAEAAVSPPQQPSEARLACRRCVRNAVVEAVKHLVPDALHGRIPGGLGRPAGEKLVQKNRD